MDYNSQYQNYLNIFNAELDKAIKNLDELPALLKESMSYSILNGGKRVRPVLCLAVSDTSHIYADRLPLKFCNGIGI